MPKLKGNAFLVILIVLFAFLESGCSMLAPSTHGFSVTTNVPDARIFVNGSYVGNGNVKTIVPRDRIVSVMAQKEGYNPASMYVGTTLSTAGKLDLFPGCFFIFPLIGLSFPGSQELIMDSVSLFLYPSSGTVVVNVPNSDGTTTPVTLTRQGSGYIGPQGEYYQDTPTVDQLKALYGK